MSSKEREEHEFVQNQENQLLRLSKMAERRRFKEPKPEDDREEEKSERHDKGL